MARFRLTLHKTYYDKGFFNVTVEFDRFVRSSEGPIKLLLGKSGEIVGHINRRANLNGTARIMGGSALRDWFQRNYRPLDIVDVDLSAVDKVRLG